MSNQTATIADWLIEYRKIVSSYNICEKTIANHTTNIVWIETNLGNFGINTIKPYEIAIPLKSLAKQLPTKAKRLLIEIKNMFTEAIIYDWTERNPASHLKSASCPVMRQRLSIEDWAALYYHAKLNSPYWVHLLLLLALITGQRRSDLLKLKYSDIKDDNLLVTQQKTGVKLAIPLALRLNEVNVSLRKIILISKEFEPSGEYLLRKSTGAPLCAASLSAAFERCADAVLPGKNTSLHECRSLSERLYRLQGIDTRILLGHSSQRMTDMYNNDRGLNKDTYTVIKI